MAPRPSKRQRTAPKDLEDKPVQSSFDVVAGDMVKTARNALTASEKRRALKRKSIEEKHGKEAKKIEAQISSLFDERRQRVAKLQVAQWEKLDALNKRRMHLEGLILATMKSMERHTLILCNDLSAIFEGRIEDIQGNLAVLQTQVQK